MKRLILLFALVISLGCTRRPLSYKGCPNNRSTEVATIAVSVDWTISGFDTSDLSRSDEDFIHRVSFRFFPLDGSPPFERYIEDDVEVGEIVVPAGIYSVVVYNESINDSYWHGSINFVDCDSFERFAAEIDTEEQDSFGFYTPTEGENLAAEPFKLASAAIEHFEVSKAMCGSDPSAWSAYDKEQAAQLSPVVPRPLTCYTTIEVATERLSSASSIRASLSGLAHRVFMASGESDTETTTHINELTQVKWHDPNEQLHGTISERFLTFTTPTSSTTHTLTLDVILVDGTRHYPTEEMIYDVTDQITQSALGIATRYAEQDLRASVALSLPEVAGDVEVNDWGDDNVITIF